LSVEYNGQDNGDPLIEEEICRFPFSAVILFSSQYGKVALMGPLDSLDLPSGVFIFVTSWGSRLGGQLEVGFFLDDGPRESRASIFFCPRIVETVRNHPGLELIIES